MSDAKNQSSAPPGQPSTEPSAATRIAELQAKLMAIRQEVRTIQGKLANRDPALADRLKKENEEFRARVILLEKALLAVLVDSVKPRQPDEAKLSLEAVRVAAIEYFKKTNIDPTLWKNIES